MAKKIILFLSDYKDDAKTYSYGCPDGTEVKGLLLQGISYLFGIGKANSR